MERCDQCGGRIDRPGLFGCSLGHPSHDLAERIAASIERDLNDRRGMAICGLPSETQEQIREVWAKLIREHLSDAFTEFLL